MATSTATPDSSNKNFHRSIGLLTAICVVAGSVIGSGIFRKPALMAAQLGSPTLLLGIWVVAGFMTLFGALTIAEIGGMFPETGGQYFFFTKIYGEFTSYLYGWALFSVIQTGSIASIAYIFAEAVARLVDLPHFPLATEQSILIHLPFIGNIFPLADFGVKVVAILTIIALTTVNYCGIVFGSAVQNFITFFKIAALLALIALGFSAAHGSFSHFSEHLSTAPTSFGGIFAALIAAASGAFWAYDGWNNVTFIAGEIKDPQRNLPRSLFFGICTVITVYVLINMAYIYALPFGLMPSSKLVATDMAREAVGAWGEKAVLIAILLSTFGACNGSLMSGARIYFAMAREKMFFHKIGVIHPRFSTPANALWLQCFWSGLLILSGTFDMLTDMLIFVAWLSYGMGTFGVFILRKRLPNAERPYKVWGYPYIPALYVCFTAVFLVVTLYEDIKNYNAGTSPLINSVFGMFIVFLGSPLYFYFKARNKKALAQK